MWLLLSQESLEDVDSVAVAVVVREAVRLGRGGGSRHKMLWVPREAGEALLMTF